MVEQWIENPRVSGSTPLLDIKIKFILSNLIVNPFFLIMNLQTINLLLQLKNMSMLKKESCIIKFTINNFILVNFLYKENYIQSFYATKTKTIFIMLRYFVVKNLFNTLKIVSSPSLKYFFKYQDIWLLTCINCKKKKIGGKLLFSIF